jgi:drug/metabolite transporter (DMT)-like permease
MEPLLKLFKSKVSRVIGVAILVVILASVITDSLDGEIDAMLTPLLTAIGSSAVGLFLGIGLLRVLPNAAPPRMRQGWYILAILCIVGGAAVPLLLLVKAISLLAKIVLPPP